MIFLCLCYDAIQKLFQVVSDLRFPAQYQAECYLALSNGHHRTGNNKKFCPEFWFNETFWPKLASPWGCNPIKPHWQEVDKLRRGLRFVGLSKLRSDRIFIDLSVQCPSELEDWCMVKRKSLLWAQILDLHQRQPRSHFSCQGDFYHLEEAAKLILSSY